MDWTAALILLYITVQVSETVSQTNVALNKPAAQISVSGSYGPQNAVDGHFSSDVSSGACALTEEGPTAVPKWWQVDLQDIYDVKIVTVLNRASEILDDFTVRIYDSDPRVGNPPSKMCCNHWGTIVEGSGSIMYCVDGGTAGRFLRIEFHNLRNEAMALCEVEAEAVWLAEGDVVPPTCEGTREMTFLPKAGSRINSNILATYQNVTKLDCIVICWDSTTCQGINYEETMGPGTVNCELFNELSPPSQDVLWDVYYLSS